MIVDPVTNKPVRVQWLQDDTGAWVRRTAGRNASKSIVPRPEVWRQDPKPSERGKQVPLGVVYSLKHPCYLMVTTSSWSRHDHVHGGSYTTVIHHKCITHEITFDMQWMLLAGI